MALKLEIVSINMFQCFSRWWFQICLIFTPPFWLAHIFQRGLFNHQLLVVNEWLSPKILYTGVEKEVVDSLIFLVDSFSGNCKGFWGYDISYPVLVVVMEIEAASAQKMFEAFTMTNGYTHVLWIYPPPRMPVTTWIITFLGSGVLINNHLWLLLGGG